MRLSDHLIAECGSARDIGGVYTRMCASLREAERFELSDDVGRAAYNLTKSKPTTLLSALPLCRTPFRKIWLEWRGGLTSEWLRPEQRRPKEWAPDPLKQGCLIETDKTGTRGVMTFAWLHKLNPVRGGAADPLYTPVNIAPLGVMFNWNEDGDAREDAIDELQRRFPTPEDRRSPNGVLQFMLLQRHIKTLSDDEVKAWMERSVFENWGRFAKMPGERQALIELDRHMVKWISPHAVGFVDWTAKMALKSDELLDRFMTYVIKASWEPDIEGEPPYAETVIAMMNSRNAVEHHPADLSALNKSRAKRGRPIFLSYRTTHLRLSQAQQRAFRAGLLTREEAGLHRVRGHFKIRKTGVYWWSPFFRGDPDRALERQEYEVT
ncbi:hypothetical protein [Bradyrhizobium japonicum]|uniref:hypothetical protein n=1 Tax=Bradyrhizobium japonicum TaxID=375 RepID=UPI001E38B115|nr:hypothetical protein [Bradyrhizobium japonicum]MCD9821231.1 hypothetical protein [Bradyrhizobium japonicum]MEB2674073.1 hypothetical protein [Bradyrhizobium japonicum]WRI93259.1 hypothetical protein R3F75_20940 [Bradyrhizobium japonicum]